MATPFILVVEDERIMRRMIALGLAGRYRVREAGNGQEALQCIRKELPSLIVTDITMPVMDGLSLCAALRSDPRTRAIPIIALTANSKIGDMERGLQAGVSLYLTKPVDVEQLRERVARYLP